MKENKVYTIPHAGLLVFSSAGFLIADTNGLATGVLAWGLLNITVRVYKDYKEMKSI
jgi:hypothetical protein